MPLSLNEIKDRALAFSREWEGANAEQCRGADLLERVLQSPWHFQAARGHIRGTGQDASALRQALVSLTASRGYKVRVWYNVLHERGGEYNDRRPHQAREGKATR